METPLSSAFQIANPLFDSYSVRWHRAFFNLGLGSLLLSIALVLLTVLRRFRQSRGRERHQLKWLLSGTALLAVLVAGGYLVNFGLGLPVGGILFDRALLGPLLGIGVALVRHRLYDIIIQRTLLYGGVSAILALVYYGSVMLLQVAFSSAVAGRSPLIIVRSTLVTAALLTLLFGAVTVLGGRGFAIVYFPGADPAPALTVAGTPEQIARGEYLSNISCLGCHGSFPDGFAGDPQPPLAGGVDMAAEEGLGMLGQLATENLTPGGKLADYSDGEIFRALRHGVDSEGRRLGFMSLVAAGELSDDDLEAVIAYMRSLPPATTDSPTGDRLSYIGLLFFGAGMLPMPDARPDTIAAPPAGASPAYGEYLATIGDCRACQGPDMTGTPASALGPAVPNPRPLVSNMSVDEFHDMMRTGIRPGNSPFPDTMPWRNASQMSDEDLSALYAYPTTTP